MKKTLLFFSLLAANILFAQENTMTINVSLTGGIPKFTTAAPTTAFNLKNGGTIRLVSDKSLKGYTLLVGCSGTPAPLIKNTLATDIQEVTLAIGGDQKISFNGQPGSGSVTGTKLTISLSRSASETAEYSFDVTMKTADQDLKDFVPSGIALTDALILKRTLNKDSIRLLLSHYTFGDTVFSSIEDARNYYSDADQAKGNAFIKDYLTAKKAEIDAAGPGAQSGNASGISKAVSQGLSSIGGLDVTNIADGFAKFIVKRTKQELSIAFFENFKDALDKQQDLKTLFPQTFKTLNAIDDQIYMYEAYIMTLRESFEKDLASLPSNLPEILDNYKPYFDKNPELRAELLSAFYIAQEIQDKQHPGDIIENYPVNTIFSNDSIDPNVKASIQTLQLISTSLQASNPDGNYWESPQQLKMLATDQKLLKIYMGLLEQKAQKENIVFTDAAGRQFLLANALDESFKTYLNYQPYFKTFIGKIQSLDTKIKGLNKIENDSLQFESYYGIVTAGVDLIKYAGKIEPLLFPADTSHKLQKDIDKYTDLAQTAANIAIDVNRRNYSSAVVNTVELLSSVIKQYSYKKTSRIKTMDAMVQQLQLSVNRASQNIQYNTALGKAAAELKKTLTLQDAEELANTANAIIKKEKDKTKQGLLLLSKPEAIGLAFNYINKDTGIYKTYEAAKIALAKQNTALLEFKSNHIDEFLSDESFQQILKYGTFMATLVHAKSSDDVEAAIEAFAMPTGSARVKRESCFNVALNAYCGPYVGNESANRWSGGASKLHDSYGITAPIGIAASWGIFKHSSISVFASIIDLGAITTFRFQNDTVQTLQKIELGDIFSPGIFLSWGIPKCPISVNAGYQITPILNSVSATANGYEASLSRLSVSICVDIPVLNFYTKPKKKIN